MIPRYRAVIDLSAETGKQVPTADGVLEVTRQWISKVEEAPVPELGTGEVVLKGGSIVALTRHGSSIGEVVALRYDRAQQGSVWRSELAFEPAPAGGRVSVGISSAVRRFSGPRGRGYAPGVVGRLMSKYGASAGMPLLAEPIPVESEEIETLLPLLTSPSRRAAIVIVSVDEFSEKPLVDVGELQKRVLGLAQVIVVGKRAAFRLTQRLQEEIGHKETARRWTVFGGGVRLYWPGLDFSRSDPFGHRLWVPRDGILQHGKVEEELFDTLAWASIQKEDPGWIDTSTIQRLVDKDAIEAARAKASQDAEFFDEYCRALEAEKSQLERERAALIEQRREAYDRADEAERGRESLRYQYDQLVSQAEELRKKIPAASGQQDDDAFTVLRYCKGGQRERDCVDELDLSEDERTAVDEGLAWLASPGAWARPAGKLEHLRDDVHEFRLNVRDHWLRLLVARMPKFRAVLVLHAFAKKTNELPASEIKVAVDRLKELGAA